MRTLYVGPGGNDASNGFSRGTRKLTLTGIEDIPVLPGDEILVYPGIYREELTIDVSGVAGAPITFVADVTGERTDGVGGVVRITASDNDQTPARNRCIWIDGKDYRIFRGFRLDMADTYAVQIHGADYITFEDCAVVDNDEYGIYSWFAMTDLIVRRCAFVMNGLGHIGCGNGATVDNVNHVFENCLFVGNNTWTANIYIQRVGGITIRNCSFLGSYAGIQVAQALSIGQSETVENCIFDGCNTALTATAVGEIVEDFNAFDHNGTDRVNTNVGANSNSYPSLITMPLLHSGASQISGFRLPWWFGSLSKWSPLRQIVGSNEPNTDLFGIQRPRTGDGAIAALASWGPIQFFDYERSIVRAFDGTQSAVMHDNAAIWKFVPRIDGTQITISSRVFRSNSYVGRLPEMRIKQPGQDDKVTVDTLAAEQWNLLTDTFTPAVSPPWLVVELRSNEGFETITTSSTITVTGTSTSTITVTVATSSTTTVTLPGEVWFDAVRVV